MGPVSGITVFVVIWWLVVFMVLPWGNRPIPQEDADKGHAPSAPVKPRLVLKMAITTVIASIIWLAVYWFIDSGLVSFRPQPG